MVRCCGNCACSYSNLYSRDVRGSLGQEWGSYIKTITIDNRPIFFSLALLFRGIFKRIFTVVVEITLFSRSSPSSIDHNIDNEHDCLEERELHSSGDFCVLVRAIRYSLSAFSWNWSPTDHTGKCGRNVRCSLALVFACNGYSLPRG